MMNAATGIFLAARSKKGWTNPYVTDGLVAMWDGEWNAGGGFHDSAATVWKDLIGTDDLTVDTGGVWRENSIDNFANANRIAYRSSFSFDAPLTQELVFQFNGPKIARLNSIMFHISQWYSGYSMLRGMHAPGGGEAFFQLKTSSSGPDSVISSVLPMSVSSRYGASGVSDAFVNGNAVRLSFIGGNWYASDADGVNLGNRSDKGRGSYIRFFAIRFYSRHLTASEIAANYAVDKARFNLP